MKHHRMCASWITSAATGVGACNCVAGVANPVPTIAAAVALDAAANARNWTRDDRDAVEARCAAWARANDRDIFNAADVAYILKTRAETLPRGAFQLGRDSAHHDPEYADVDEAGQLALGITGEQRAIPGLARPLITDESIAQDKAASPFFCADDYR